jgi:MFS family permease
MLERADNRVVRLPRTFEPLRIRDFALLWSGMTVSLFGDYFFFVALAWETYQLSNTPTALGWVSAAYFTPTVVLLVGGGVVTDRFERRRVMIVADALRAASIGMAGGLAIAGDLRLWELAGLVALTGVGDALFRPAFGSIVPEIVPPELLAQANSLDQFVRPAAGLLGPATAGVLIAASGAGAAMVVDAATFMVAIGTAFALTPRPLQRQPERSLRREIREGFAFVRSRTWLWASLVASTMMNVAVAARMVLLPFLVKNTLHASALGYGLVSSALAAGALVSSLAYGQRGLPRRHVLVMYLGWTAFSCAIAAYGIGTSIPELVVFAFTGGLGFAVGQAIWGTMMHRLVPGELLGRVTSLDLVSALSLMPVYMATVGFVAAGIGVRTTLITAGAVGALITVLFLVATPGIRASERDGSMATGALGQPMSDGLQP